MNFGIHTLFTKFRERPSTRLRILSRALQWYGIAIAVATVGLVLYQLTAPNSKNSVQLGDLSPFKLFLTGALQTASLIIIGRELLRRKRWAGYLTAITLGVPIVSRWGSAHPFQTPEILIAVAAIGTLITVRNELRSVRDLDLVDDVEDLEPYAAPDPIPSRGFGQRRSERSQDRPESETSTRAPDVSDGEASYRDLFAEPLALPLETIPAPTSTTERRPEPIRTQRDN